MAPSNSPCIDPIIGRVNADKPDQHQSDGIVDFHNQAVLVATDVENRSIARNEINRRAELSP
jgi:hypothetical protein